MTIEKWYLNTNGLLTEVWLLKALVTLKADFTLYMQYMLFFMQKNSVENGKQRD